MNQERALEFVREHHHNLIHEWNLAVDHLETEDVAILVSLEEDGVKLVVIPREEAAEQIRGYETAMALQEPAWKVEPPVSPGMADWVAIADGDSALAFRLHRKEPYQPGTTAAIMAYRLLEDNHKGVEVDAPSTSTSFITMNPWVAEALIIANEHLHPVLAQAGIDVHSPEVRAAGKFACLTRTALVLVFGPSETGHRITSLSIPRHLIARLFDQALVNLYAEYGGQHRLVDEGACHESCGLAAEVLNNKAAEIGADLRISTEYLILPDPDQKRPIFWSKGGTS